MVAITGTMQRSIVVAWTLIAIAMGQVFYWMYDRSPPLVIFEYTASPTQPNGTMLINGDVKRSLDRECSAVLSRTLIDANGYRSAIGGSQIMTADAIRKIDDANHNKMLVAIPIPKDIVPGPAVLATSMSYTCNPIHQLWPIEMLIEMNVEILPEPEL